MNKILILMLLLLSLYLLFDSKEYFVPTTISTTISTTNSTTISTTNSTTISTTNSTKMDDVETDITDLINKMDIWDTLSDELKTELSIVLIMLFVIFNDNIKSLLIIDILPQAISNFDGNTTFIEMINTLKLNLQKQSLREILKIKLTTILNDIISNKDIIDHELLNDYKKYGTNIDSYTKLEMVKKINKTMSVKDDTATKTNKTNDDLNQLLTKKSCIDKDKNCSLGHVPYSELELYGINPSTKQKFTTNEKEDLRTIYDNKCKSSKGEKQICCDKFDNKLEGVRKYIPQKELDKFHKVNVKKCNNKITDIKVCSKDEKDCGEGNWRKPSVYEICKLQNLDDGDYTNKTDIDVTKLTPDCLINKCNNNEIHLRIDQKYNNDSKITEHYYLINGIKSDNVDYLSEYFNTKYNTSVNDKLLFGYSGNTVFHHAIYYNSFKCIEYLLTTNFDYSNVNSDDNSVLHIACLRGNYEAVFKLLKHGVSVECKNIHGDTALHSSVRSGSYNCVKILLENNAGACVLEKNKYGETPLHTTVIPVTYETELEDSKETLTDRMNFNIVRLLVEYGSDIHNKNNKGELIIQTLLKKNKSIVREEIRTYLQRQYYHKYTSSEYEALLEAHKEIRPFELDTKLDEELEEDYEEYDKNNIEYKNLVTYTDDSESDYNLYTKKRTRALKDKVPIIEGFHGHDNGNGIEGMKIHEEFIGFKTCGSKINNIIAIILVIIALLYIVFNK
jgi:hypothetical protein